MKLRSWLKLAQRAVVEPVSYEGVAKAPREFLNNLEIRYEFDVASSFTPVATYKGLATEPFVPQPYAPMEIEDIAHVRGAVDLELEKIWGYSLPAKR